MRHNPTVYLGAHGVVMLRISRSVWAATAAIALVGCNSSSGTQTTTDNSGGGATKVDGKALKVGIVFDSGGRGDKSFNDSAWDGISLAKKDFGIEEKSVDSKAEKDYEGNISTLAEQGCDLIFAVGFAQARAVTTVSKKFPNIKFAIIDAEVKADNVRSLLFSEEQGSFLAGYLGALTSKTGKLGFVGGKKIPLIEKFESGYIAGAKTANEKVEVLPSKYTESWDDTNLGKQMASVLFTQGADVVYHAAGRCGLGVINAAKESGKFAIGVDSNQDDQAPGFVLTSMIKRVDTAVYSTIKDVKDGKFTAGAKVYDLKSGGVGLSDFKYTKEKISPDALKKLDVVKQEIIDGKIVVPATSADLAKFKPTK